MSTEPTARDLEHLKELNAAIRKAVYDFVAAQPDKVDDRTVMSVLIGMCADLAYHNGWEGEQFLGMAQDAFEAAEEDDEAKR